MKRAADDVLAESLKAIMAQYPMVAPVFYWKLFVSHPELVGLFRRYSFAEQRQMLHDALVFIVDHARNPDHIRPVLLDLGLRHHGYGVVAEMYTPVIECLLATLEELAGPTWTPPAAAAWRSNLEEIARIMATAPPVVV